MRNVGIRGKAKLADRWEEDVYVVVSQPTPDIPVFEVKKEHSREKPRVLHRNLLLPFMGIPLSKNQVTSSNSSDSPKSHNVSLSFPNSPLDVSVDIAGTSDTKEVQHSSVDNSVDTSPVSPSDNVSSVSGITKPVPKYVIPARRVKPSYCTVERPRRTRVKPAWMRSDDWKL